MSRRGRPGGRGRRKVEIDGQAAVLELGRPAQDGFVGTDHERVAVEDQLVLTADHVDVREDATRLGGSSPAQVETGVVLVAFVRRTVDNDEQAGTRCPGGGDGSALLPQVFADRQRDVDPVQPDDAQVVARDEVPELVEDSVVRQMVLRLGGDNPSSMQEGNGVLR